MIDMAPAAGLRNRLAHEYNEVEPRKVQAAVRAAIEHARRYLEAVQRFADAH